MSRVCFSVLVDSIIETELNYSQMVNMQIIVFELLSFHWNLLHKLSKRKLLFSTKQSQTAHNSLTFDILNASLKR